MIGKFATVIALTLLVVAVLMGGQAFAQDTPSGQTPATPPPAPTPAAQQPAAPTPAAQQPDTSQEPADEDSISRRKARPHDYKNWNYNIGAGANVDSGSTREFVRAGGIDATAGVARNANKYLGLRADFIFANLPLRDSTLQLAGATGATSYVLGLTLDPIINFSVTRQFSAYVLLGPGFYHRSGHLDSDTAVPGSACNPFWNWGACSNVSIPISGDFVNTNQNEFGYNAGGGVARKMPSGVEIYAEYRLMHGNHNSIQTDVRPITIGVRW
jgi:opacity protein-like surface antigen